MIHWSFGKLNCVKSCLPGCFAAPASIHVCLTQSCLHRWPQWPLCHDWYWSCIWWGWGGLSMSYLSLMSVLSSYSFEHMQYSPKELSTALPVIVTQSLYSSLWSFACFLGLSSWKFHPCTKLRFLPVPPCSFCSLHRRFVTYWMLVVSSPSFIHWSGPLPGLPVLLPYLLAIFPFCFMHLALNVQDCILLRRCILKACVPGYKLWHSIWND